MFPQEVLDPTGQGQPVWLVVTGVASGDTIRGGQYEAVVTKVSKGKDCGMVAVRCLEDRAHGEGKDQVTFGVDTSSVIFTCQVIAGLPENGTIARCSEISKEGDGRACVFQRDEHPTEKGYTQNLSFSHRNRYCLHCVVGLQT